MPDDEPGPDRLTGPYLLFTASFDGPLDTYLDELCDELAAEAQEIWGRCAAAPQPPAGAPLKAYLRAHHQTTGFFVAAYPDATVGQVRAALAQREDVIAFARAAQGMDPAHLQAAFLRTDRRVTVAGVSIDLADLQGDVLRAYGNDYAHTAYLFFRVDDAGAGAPGCGACCRG